MVQINFIKVTIITLSFSSLYALYSSNIANAQVGGQLGLEQPNRSSVEQLLRDWQSSSQIESGSAAKTIIEVKVSNSTVFSQEELAVVTSPFVGREITFEEISTIRNALTQFYISKGYITSGVFLPPQNISTGVIQFIAVEGELEDIEFLCQPLVSSVEMDTTNSERGSSELKPKCPQPALRRLATSYVTSRLRSGAKPLNRFKLNDSLEQLQQNPLFSRIQAELVAGSAPQKSVLILNLTQAPALSSVIAIDNKNSSSVGSLGITAAVSHNNFFGFGDSINIESGITEGISTYSLNYAIPLNPHDGKLIIAASRGRSKIIEETFAPLDINSRATTYSVGFRQPITRSPSSEFAFGLSADVQNIQTFLFDDEPFSFNLGAENGESNVTAIRLTTDWIKANSTSSIAAKSRFSLGLDFLGSTINDSGTDGRFLSWNGSIQWVKAVNFRKNIILATRVAAQLTKDSLLLGEQFTLGGFNSVRGYQYGYAAHDSGIVGSIEVQFPILQDPQGIGTIQLVPFFDLGTGWSNNDIDSSNTLSSIGVGVRYQLKDYLYATIDWGIPLVNIDNRNDSLQNDGLSFSIRIKPF